MSFEEDLAKYRELVQKNSQSRFQDELNQYRQKSILPEPLSTPEDEANFLQRNLGIPAGIVGSLGGAAGGMMLGGPPGAVAGGIIGGAGGGAAGTYVSETKYKGTPEVEAYKLAVEDALWSLGFDLVTLGIGSKVNLDWFAKRMAKGDTVEQAGKELVEGAYGAGSRESLQLSQQMLMRGGATLLPSQIRGSGLDRFREALASAGLISRGTMQDNAVAVNDVVRDELSELINKNAAGMAADPYAMGDAFYTVISEGKRVIQDTYVRGLDDISRQLNYRGANVDPDTILKPMDEFLKAQRGDVADAMSEEALAFTASRLGRLASMEGVGFHPRELILLDKAFTRDISAKFGSGANKNPAIEAELSQVAEVFRDAIQTALNQVDPKVATEYKNIKGLYREGQQALFPRINSNYIRQAGEGNYLGLGNLAANATNLNQIMQMKASLKAAYKEAAKDETSTLPFSSADEIDEIFRRGYLSARVSQVFDETFSMNSLTSLAKKMNIPAEAKKMQAVLGPDYGRFKQVMNVVLEAGKTPGGDVGLLALRQAEISGAKGLSQIAGSMFAGGGAQLAVTGGVSVAPVVAAGVAALYIPQVLAKIATNPAFAQRLLEVNARNKGLEYADVAVKLLISDVVDSMTDTEKNGMIDFLSNVASQTVAPTKEEENVPVR